MQSRPLHVDFLDFLIEEQIPQHSCTQLKWIRQCPRQLGWIYNLVGRASPRGTSGVQKTSPPESHSTLSAKALVGAKCIEKIILQRESAGSFLLFSLEECFNGLPVLWVKICQPSGYVFKVLCHQTIYHQTVLLPNHFVAKPFCRQTILSPNYFVAKLFCRQTILLPTNYILKLLCQQTILLQLNWACARVVELMELFLCKKLHLNKRESSQEYTPSWALGPTWSFLCPVLATH